MTKGIYDKPVGVSLLTNGARLEKLKACISSFLSNCYYRPLVFGIFNNGSTDGTREWLNDLPEMYGVRWRIEHSQEDMGCAAGTNQACELVRYCEYAIHLESDFEHMPESVTGEDKLWLRRVLALMESEGADYLYLRRMVEERDLALHWWSQWVSRVTGSDTSGRYLRCPGFWWSNNPHLRRNSTLYSLGTLPLNEKMDGPKGTPGWSQPELSAPRPGKAWIHRWGLFVHDPILYGDRLKIKGCGPQGCKYGFFMDGTGPFCESCDKVEGFQDLTRHEMRFRSKYQWVSG